MSKKLIVLIMIVLLLVVLVGVGLTYHEQPRFCSDLCHIMGPYLGSWQESDYGAAAHAAQGVACLDCHEPTIQEQVNELLVFVRGDYSTPLQELEVSDEFCYDCHMDDEHEDTDQVVQRTAEREQNPHDSHLIGELGCSTCHKMHKPSQDLCAECHGAIATGAGWTTEVTGMPEIQVWDPDMDCTACKIMVPYVDSLEGSDLSARAHAQEGLGCVDCHNDLELVNQTHEEAVPGASIGPLRIRNEFCLDCHVENRHASYEQIAERTADYTIDGELHNPHDPHPDTTEVEEIPCWRCHSSHKESRLIDGCYSGCHHEHPFEKCSNCHKP